MAVSLAAGEFVEEPLSQGTTSVYPGQQNIQSQTVQSQDPQIDFQQALQQQSQLFNTNSQVFGIKTKGMSYFNWFLGALKNPVIQSEEGNFNYATVTLFLAALAMGGALFNYVRRFLGSINNVVIRGEAFQTVEPERYQRIKMGISQQFNFVTLLTLTVSMLVIYLLAVLLSAMVERLSNKQYQTDFKREIGKSSQFLPVLLALNLIGFLVTFLIPSQLRISERFGYIGELLVSSVSNPFELISNYMRAVHKILAINAYGNVLVYLLIVALAGFFVLMIALISNIKTGYKSLNAFYASFIAVLLFVAVVYLVDRLVLNHLIERFRTFYTLIGSNW